jgi:hypothetical protein
VAGDDVVEGSPIRPGDFDNDSMRYDKRYIGNGGGNVIRRDSLEQPR